MLAGNKQKNSTLVLANPRWCPGALYQAFAAIWVQIPGAEGWRSFGDCHHCCFTCRLWLPKVQQIYERKVSTHFRTKPSIDGFRPLRTLGSGGLRCPVPPPFSLKSILLIIVKRSICPLLFHLHVYLPHKLQPWLAPWALVTNSDKLCAKYRSGPKFNKSMRNRLQISIYLYIFSILFHFYT